MRHVNPERPRLYTAGHCHPASRRHTRRSPAQPLPSSKFGSPSSLHPLVAPIAASLQHADSTSAKYMHSQPLSASAVSKSECDLSSTLIVSPRRLCASRRRVSVPKDIHTAAQWLACRPPQQVHSQPGARASWPPSPRSWGSRRRFTLGPEQRLVVEDAEAFRGGRREHRMLLISREPAPTKGCFTPGSRSQRARPARGCRRRGGCRTCAQSENC